MSTNALETNEQSGAAVGTGVSNDQETSAGYGAVSALEDFSTDGL
jgi:hypothetical protein